MKSSASDVLEGIDPTGKNVVLTGGYSGIGIEAARALPAAGAKVTVPARRPDVASEALGAVSSDIEVATMDLVDISSVRAFADDYLDTGRPLHMLINNAGIMACPLSRVGPGWESQFGVNHLGHMQLGLGLLPALEKADGARMVCLSSTAHILTDVHRDDPHFNSHDYDKWQAYGQAKSANALFALGADMRWKDKGIRSFGVHPGGIFTDPQRHLTTKEMAILGWMNDDGTIPERVQKSFKTPEQGASTSPQLVGKGGVYCEDCDIAQLATQDSQRYQHAREWICD